MNKPTPILAAAISAFFVCAHARAADPQYTITDLGNIIPTAINDHGQIVGYTNTQASDHKPVLWENGQLSLISSGLPLAEAHSINNAGQIVGKLVTNSQSPAPAAFLTSAGQTAPLDIPAWQTDFRFYYGINNLGQIVGQAQKKAFLWDNGSLTYLDVGAAPEFSSAYAINDSGQIAGLKQTSSSGGPGFLYDHGNVTFLSTPAIDINNLGQVLLFSAIWQNGQETHIDVLNPAIAEEHQASIQAAAINQSGQVVGVNQEIIPYIDNDGDNNAYSLLRGFLWDPQHGTRDINDLLGITDLGRYNRFEHLTDINNAGQIIGYGSEGSAFLLTPIPEPGAAAAFIVIASLLPRRRRCLNE